MNERFYCPHCGVPNKKAAALVAELQRKIDLSEGRICARPNAAIINHLRPSLHAVPDERWNEICERSRWEPFIRRCPWTTPCALWSNDGMTAGLVGQNTHTSYSIDFILKIEVHPEAEYKLYNGMLHAAPRLCRGIERMDFSNAIVVIPGDSQPRIEFIAPTPTAGHDIAISGWRLCL